METLHPFLERILPELDRLVRLAAGAQSSPTNDIPASDGVLIALSGGADSTALLLAAAARRDGGGGPVAAAHLNHLLRGSDSDADEAFCRDLCARLGIPLAVRRADARAAAAERGRGEEEAGRHLRREFLLETLAADPSLACCATGHHRDDQVETIVMRLFRGTGLDGLRGIRPVCGPFIHPMLAAGRDEIASFLTDAGQPWRTDRTNLDGGAARSRIRHELLPLAREILGSGVDAGPARLARLAGRDADLLDAMADEALAAMTDEAAARGEPGPESEPPALPAAATAALPRPLGTRILRRILAERCGLERDLEMAHLDALLDWLATGRSGGALDLIRGWRALRDGDRLLLLAPGDPPAGRGNDLSPNAYFHILEEQCGPETAGGPGTEPEPGIVPHPGSDLVWRLTVPRNALHGRPRLRRWRAGDRIVPFGMEGRKKVSDLLAERKIPHADRARALVVEDDAGILWVAGIARAERTRLLPGSGPGVTLTLLETEQPPAGEPESDSGR